MCFGGPKESLFQTALDRAMICAKPPSSQQKAINKLQAAYFAGAAWDFPFKKFAPLKRFTFDERQRSR
ncbi:MAG: hypothetical protein U5N55_11095 [Cypionkella sp.]|nr:hypothetical protein [Cypionkella sp.]